MSIENYGWSSLLGSKIVRRARKGLPRRLTCVRTLRKPSLLRRDILAALISFISLIVIQPALAQLPPPTPDGGYPGANTAEGTYALFSVTSGFNDTALGYYALRDNTDGNGNTAIGAGALNSNTSGSYNTANGEGALSGNVTNAYNTASGFEALINATADDNTATGAFALVETTTGSSNTATGVSALYSNTTGYYNVASGVSSLYYNLSGHENTAEGYQALMNNKGSHNIALGAGAGANLTTGNNNIDIGNVGAAGDGAKIRLGTSGTHTATLIAGIYGKSVNSGTGVAVMIDSNGKLGTVLSSARYKEAIRPMEKD